MGTRKNQVIHLCPNISLREGAKPAITSNRNPQQCAHRGIENGVQIAGKNSGIPQDQFKCLNLKALGQKT